MGICAKIQKSSHNSGTNEQPIFKTEGITLIAFPNPFSMEVNVTYQINQDFLQASLKVMDYLGKEIQTYPLPNAKGTLELSTRDLSAGLYTYKLFVDGHLVQMGKLIKE